MHKALPDKQRILILCSHPPDCAPNQRFRFELFIRHLNAIEQQYTVSSAFSQADLKVVYQSKNKLAKLWVLLKVALKRTWDVLRSLRYDAVMIVREAYPIGPPWVEFLMYCLGRAMIYDYDDAVWLTNSLQQGRWVGLVKCSWKIKWILRWSRMVFAGNDYLADYARRYNSNVVLMPTIVDTDHFTPIEKTGAPLCIGWMGSKSTAVYMKVVEPALQQLAQSYDFQLMVIGDGSYQLDGVPCYANDWSLANELEQLRQFDIGLVPLTDDPWSRGKCGCKIFQYMALALPSVASPVSAHKHIIQDGVQGYHAATTKEWYHALERLLQSEELRKQMGQAARQHVVDTYSLHAHGPRFAAALSQLSQT